MRGTPPARPLLASLTLLALAACNTTPNTGSRPNPYEGGAQYPWTDTNVNAQAGLINGYLSDQAWTFASSGWGPIEPDRSNGEQNAGDGRQISLNGVKFNKGLGVHANSRVQYNLSGQCQSFTAVIGLDDEIRYQNQYGSVTFEVWVDGTKLYDSGTITQSTPNKTVSVDVFGRSSMTLVVNQQNENNWFDHADWADARVNCDGGAPGPLPNEWFITDLAPTNTMNGWGPIEYDTSNGEQLAGDGRTLQIRGQQFARGLGVHAASEVTYALSNCTRFRAVVGIDDEVGGRGSAIFSVRVFGAGGGELYNSGVVTGTSAAKTVDVSINPGATSLQLSVLASSVGPGAFDYAHADWADAKLTCTTPPPPPPPPPPAPGTWSVLGNAPLDAAAYRYGDMALASDGQPYVSLSLGTYPNLDVAVRRWGGTGWEAALVNVGSASVNAESAIALDASGRVYVAFPNFNSANPDQSTVVVKRFENFTWAQVGDPIVGNFASGSLHMRFDPAGRLVVSFTTVPASTPIVNVWRLNGSSWVKLGALEGFGAALGFDSAGRPVIAAGGGGLPGTPVKVHYFDGSVWQQLGGDIAPAASGSVSSTPYGVSSGLAGQLFVVYSTSGSAGGLFVKRWTGSAWALVGGNLNDQGQQIINEVISSVAPNGEPLVAYTVYTPQGIIVKRWNGSAWAALGGNVPNTERGFARAVLVDSSNRTLVYYGTDTAGAVVQRFTP